MFNPSVNDVRNFFFDTFAKANQQQALSDLEKMAYSVIMEHPEYQVVLRDREKYLNYNWLPDAGETNPFLHLSMHMSIWEQLSIDQPMGIKALYLELCEQFGDEHEAQHQVLDCLAEMVWQAQYNNMQPDPNIYLSCLRRKLGKE
ncbi:MAG: DUF1841 family protein [Burkholderiales bacterium]|nr:DUF1841 family protein [Burkholderiales bacterium]